jgi:hypothetical protein
VWINLLSILEQQDPSSIAINVDAEIAFSGGMHVGELVEIQKQLGEKWQERFVAEPMIGVEFVGTMPKGKEGDRLFWYRGLMETAWAMIGEAFSERVIEPGVTSTEVFPFPCHVSSGVECGC